MSDHKPRNEDQLAELLERAHENILGNRDSSDDNDINENLGSISDAEDLLKLIHIVKQKSPIEGAGKPDGATAAGVDLSTKKTGGEAALPTADDFDFNDGLPTTIGRFEIGETIGQGGFGFVVRGYDPQLERDVALKIPRLDSLITAESRDRFVIEAKAAAALSHPQIVTVYESGKIGPIYYLASELIEGPTLAEWMRDRGHPLSVRSAIGLVRALAEALQHAHDRGVIHRDIKPANILLAAEGDIEESQLADIAQIGDFGLAKLLETDQSNTRTGSLVGTPAYMSPEQTRSQRTATTSATDVYSLGVLLYELLTCKTPFARESLVKTVTAIQNEEPVPPSKYNPQVSRDLDAIVQKCLEKPPQSRYATAFELGRDLERLAAGHSVSARPVGRIELLRRWAGRNRGLAIAGAVTTLAVTIALVASLAGWILTAGALSRETRALNAQSIAKANAEESLATAERRYLENKHTVNTFFTMVCDNPQFKRLPQSETIRNELLNLAMGYFKKFADENQDDPDLAGEVALTHVQIGEILQEIGKPSEANAVYEEADGLLKSASVLPDESPVLEDIRVRCQLGLAETELALGKIERGISHAQQAIAIQQTIAQQKPDDAAAQLKLADALTCHALLLREQGQHGESLAECLQGIALIKKLVDDHPDQTEYRIRLASLMGQTNISMRDLGQAEKAEKITLATLMVLRSAIEDDPAMWDAVSDFVITANQAASARFRKRDLAGMRDILTEAFPHAQRLRMTNPLEPRHLQAEQTIQEKLGVCLDQLGEKKAAREQFEASLESARRLREIDTKSVNFKRDLASSTLNVSTFLGRNEFDAERSEELALESMQLWTELSEAVPNNVSYQMAIAGCLTNLSELVGDRDQLTHALEHANVAIEICENVLELEPENPQARYIAYLANYARASAQEKNLDLPEAVESYRTSLDLAPPPFKGGVRIRLLRSLISNKEHEPSLQLLAEVDQEALQGIGEFFELAMCYAMLSRLDEQSSNEHVEAAIDILTRNSEKPGFANVKRTNQLKSDDRFDALREDARFQAILANVQQQESE